MAACRLNDSIKAVSCSVRVLPTLRTSMPSVFIPTPSSTNTVQIPSATMTQEQLLLDILKMFSKL